MDLGINYFTIFNMDQRYSINFFKFETNKNSFQIAYKKKYLAFSSQCRLLS